MKESIDAAEIITINITCYYFSPGHWRLSEICIIYYNYTYLIELIIIEFVINIISFATW